MATTLTLTTIPPLADNIGPRRFRIYTVDHIPFDTLYADDAANRPYLVAATTTWLVRTIPARFGDGHILEALRSDNPRGTTWHDLHLTRYPDRTAAQRAAYNAGLTAFMVYEDSAATWGLPTGV